MSAWRTAAPTRGPASLSGHRAGPARGQRPTFRRRWLLALPVAATLAAPLAAVVPADAASPIVLGSDGAREQLQRQIGGITLASHRFAQLAGKPKDGRLINLQTNTTWRTVGNAKPGSSIYAAIVRWAQFVKGNGHSTFVTFNHEPETDHQAWKGSSSEYAAAWRHVVDIFRGQGVRNAEWTWNLTGWAFGRPLSDRQAAIHWYPGDSYVDYVAMDPYNRLSCPPGRGNWVEFETMTQSTVRWAAGHGKQVVVPETATVPDPKNPQRKAQWISNMHSYVASHPGTFRAVFYFNRNVPGKPLPSCQYQITTSSDIAAFRSLAQDAAFSGTS